MEKDPLLIKRENMWVVGWDQLVTDQLMELGTVDDGLRLMLCRDKKVFTCYHLLVVGEDDKILASTLGGVDVIIDRAEKILRRYRGLVEADGAEDKPKPSAGLSQSQAIIYRLYSGESVDVGDVVDILPRNVEAPDRPGDYKIVAINSVAYDRVEACVEIRGQIIPAAHSDAILNS